ncbi:MAG TPA: hypothetical protein VGE98_16315 [Thermoanaerobaculia bacterium]
MAHDHQHDHDHDDEAEGGSGVDLEKALSDAPPEVRELLALSAVFATTAAMFQEVTTLQYKALLDVAMTAGEVAEALLDEDGEEEFEDVGDSGEELEALLEPLTRASERLAAAASETRDALAGARQGGASGEGGETHQALARAYENTVANLNLLMQSFVSSQQELQTLGRSVVAQSVDLILGAAEEAGTFDDEDDDIS